MEGKRLSEEAFLKVIDDTPLVSIDLVVTDAQGRILLGRRVNEPAADTWFVPGGRILKGEDLGEAFDRIAKKELGEGARAWTPSRHLGVYTHQYDANVFRAPGVSTHYVVLAIQVMPDQEWTPPNAPDDQHSDYRWVSRDDLSDEALRRLIHQNSLAYFDLPLDMDPEQYYALNARRDSANTLVWQAPIVGLTGIAFLFTVLLAGDTSRMGRWIAAALAVIVCVASWQLTTKQRFTESELAKLAERYERVERLYLLNAKSLLSHPLEPGRRLHWWRKAGWKVSRWLVERSSVTVWQLLYAVIAIVAVAAAAALS